MPRSALLSRSCLSLLVAVVYTFISDDAQAQALNLFARRNITTQSLASVTFSIGAGLTATIDTRNPSTKADTVLHLFSVSENKQVSFDNNTGSRTSSIVYRNPGNSTRSYIVFMRAVSSATEGTADLFVNGTKQGNFAVSGRVTMVACGGRYTYEAAPRVGGIVDASVYGFSQNMQTFYGRDTGSGVGSMGRLYDRTDVCNVMLHGSAGMNGSVDLYVNDALVSDTDGDGLGDKLENSLGSCAQANGCLNPNPKDSDRDGIADKLELFGLDAASPIYLSRMGSSPVHKDLFIEIDQRTGIPNLFTAARRAEAETFARNVRDIFMEGTATEVGNPDGMPGIRVHLDVGLAATDPALLDVMGNWGGSTLNIAAGVSSDEGRRDSMDVNRRGIFLYALKDAGGGGQKGSTACFAWGGDTGRTFSHEVGHVFGLGHEGHSSWGNANCKPNYLSIMNYLFQEGAQGFSQGESGSVLVNAQLAEDRGVGLNPAPGFISGAPFNFDTSGQMVDWNRDGVFHDTRVDPNLLVRANATWAAANESCGAAGQNLALMTEVEPWAKSKGTPTMTRVGNRLYAFYVNASGQLRYRWGTLGFLATGSCASDTIGETCMTWSSEIVVTTDQKVRDADVVTWQNRDLILAYTTEGSGIRTKFATPDQNGALASWSAEQNIDAESTDEPDLVNMKVDPYWFGADRMLMLTWRDTRFDVVMSSGALQPGAFQMPLALIDPGLNYIPAAGSPSLAALPNGETCAAVPQEVAAGDANHTVHIYCYRPSTSVWEDVSAIAYLGRTPPLSPRKPGLAFHHLRNVVGNYLKADGGQYDVTYGQLYMVLVDSDRIPQLFISEGLDSNSLAANFLAFRKRGRFNDEWSWIHDDSGVALYEDPNVGALKGLWTRERGDGVFRNIQFLPLADGTFRTVLKDGNDFHVINRGLCLGVRMGDETYCGAKNTNPFNY